MQLEAWARQYGPFYKLRLDPGNLLEAMIAAADQPDSGINDTQVAGNVLTMLPAGEDTTANTLAWMIHLLWQNPAALAKATAEVRDVCGDARELTMEQMARLDLCATPWWARSRCRPAR